MTSEVPEEVTKANEQLIARADNLVNQSKSAIKFQLSLNKEPHTIKVHVFNHLSGVLHTMSLVGRFKDATNLEEVLTVMKTAVDDLVDEIVRDINASKSST